jgi:hypothetical protein
MKKEFICSICNRKFENLGPGKMHERNCDGSGLLKQEKIINKKEKHKGKNFIDILKEEGTYETFCQNVSLGMKKAFKEGKFTGKGSTTDLENKRREKISKTCKLKKLGGYRKGSGRGKQGRYKGIWCDSSWELAWVIYHLDHNILFERNWKKFEYNFNGKIHTYTPDFKIKDEFIEVKGYMTEQVQEKINQFPHKIKIMGKNELKPIIEYVENKYGKKYIKLYN